MGSEWPHGSALRDRRKRAELLIAFAEGQEDAGFDRAARRMRMVAQDVLDLADVIADLARHGDGSRSTASAS